MHFYRMDDSSKAIYVQTAKVLPDELRAPEVRKRWKTLPAFTKVTLFCAARITVKD